MVIPNIADNCIDVPNGSLATGTGSNFLLDTEGDDYIAIPNSSAVNLGDYSNFRSSFG